MRDWRKLAHPERKKMTVASGFERRTWKKRWKGTREARYYMGHVLGVLQEQVRLASGPNSVMLRPEDVCCMDGSWRRGVRRMKFLGV